MDAIVCDEILHAVWAEFFVLPKKIIWDELCGLEYVGRKNIWAEKNI